MKLEGDYLFEASVPEVWSALFDPVILAAVMPGCEKLELVDGSYVGEIKVKVGPIQGKFTGKVDLTDKDEPRSYKMTVDGRGAPGFIKAVATVKLAPEGDHTRVSYDSDAQIGGKIASVGQRLIDASARAIVAQSLEGLHTNIKLRAKAYRDAGVDPAAAPVAPADPKPPDPAPAREPVAADALPTAVNSQVTDAVAPAAAAPDLTELKAAAAEARTAAARPAPAAPVAFTPVKVKQADLANAVAKEVASSMFPRSLLVAIIVIEAVVILWLLVRH